MSDLPTSPDIQYRALLQAVEEIRETALAKDDLITADAINLINDRAAEIAATLTPQAISPQAAQVTDDMLSAACDDYIEACPPAYGTPYVPALRRAIAAALAAQPQMNAQPPQDECERIHGPLRDVGRVINYIQAQPCTCEVEMHSCDRCKILGDYFNQQPPAQSQAYEPVAWRYKGNAGDAYWLNDFRTDLPAGEVLHSWQPLYTHPPAQSAASSQRALVEALRGFIVDPPKHLSKEWFELCDKATAALDGLKPAGRGEGNEG